MFEFKTYKMEYQHVPNTAISKTYSPNSFKMLRRSRTPRRSPTPPRRLPPLGRIAALMANHFWRPGDPTAEGVPPNQAQVEEVPNCSIFRNVLHNNEKAELHPCGHGFHWECLKAYFLTPNRRAYPFQVVNESSYELQCPECRGGGELSFRFATTIRLSDLFFPPLMGRLASLPRRRRFDQSVCNRQLGIIPIHQVITLEDDSDDDDDPGTPTSRNTTPRSSPDPFSPTPPRFSLTPPRVLTPQLVPTRTPEALQFAGNTQDIYLPPSPSDGVALHTNRPPVIPSVSRTQHTILPIVIIPPSIHKPAMAPGLRQPTRATTRLKIEQKPYLIRSLVNNWHLREVITIEKDWYAYCVEDMYLNAGGWIAGGKASVARMLETRRREPRAEENATGEGQAPSDFATFCNELSELIDAESADRARTLEISTQRTVRQAADRDMIANNRDQIMMNTISATRIDYA
ncbi:uncharacterized protein LY89DRAFT_678032 [Mollisia scopiformis]|uniref:RING-type domain-containing protein n=1 Tax=Mollisia scopiformis TaxID=149040 RepID=A0A132B5B1_MOLSC|nr:uncharacterized protein LY89DRAFT_678032 [Mollisia scopiformis]KUJ07433.1 hypothetical protein LY89DRAFT_678032 [Mollisia scopiformis]